MNDNDLKRVGKAEKALFNRLCKKTNGDKIRSMTDEELAEFESTIGCHPDARRETCLGVDRCAECWLAWLRQEVNK